MENITMMTFERLKEILKDYEHEEWRNVSIPSYICHQFVISQYPNVVVNVDYDEKREEIANLEIYSTNYNFIIYVDYKEDVFLQLLKIACPNFNIEVKGVAVKQEKPKKPKETDVIFPFKNPNQLTFWDYIGTINMEKEYDKWRLAMDIGAEYNAMSKDPDKFINEIIQKIEQKLKTK